MLYRGSTVTLVFNVKNKELDLSQIDICHFTIANDSGRNKRTIEDCILDNENKKIKVPLSQNDTLSLETGYLLMQFKIGSINNNDYSIALSNIMRSYIEQDMEGIAWTINPNSEEPTEGNIVNLIETIGDIQFSESEFTLDLEFEGIVMDTVVIPNPPGEPEEQLNTVLIKNKVYDIGINPDWDEDDITSKAFIQNKPVIPAAQVQSNWSESDNSKVDFIKNKPTKLSDFNNDQGFINNTVNNLINYYKKSETYTQTEVNSLIGAISTISIEVVQELPTTDIQTNIIYLVPKNPARTDTIYDEYINTDGTSNSWEKIGDTEVDLLNYYTKSEVNSALNGKVDKDGENVVNVKMISGTDYVPETITDTTKLSGWYDNSGNLISSPTKCTTGFLTLSEMADSIDVYGVYTSATLVAKNNNEQCTGWNYNTLPNEFVTKYSDHITIDIEYLRNDSRKSIAINYANNSGYYTYIQKTYLSPKNLDWLRLTRKNGRLPIIVDANGNGDYTTIQAAVNAAYNFDEIIILPGSYEESVTVQNKFLYLHGLDKNTTFLVNHTGDYDTPPLFMCLGIVEGLTIYNQKTVEVSVERHSYAIHLDQLWGNTKALRSFTLRNCNVISDFAGAIGCGLVDGSRVNIEHCYIISTGVTSQDTTAFQIHGNRFAEGSSEIIVIDSVLKAPTTGDAKGLLITNGGSDRNTGTTFNLRVNNCVITKFRENVGELLTIDYISGGNNIDELNLAPQY